MNKIIYLTLAQAYKANQGVCDGVLKDAVISAAKDVGYSVVIKALCEVGAVVDLKKIA